MSTAENIREKLSRDPFQPFRVRITSGDSYVVHNPDLAVVMKSELFIAQPNSDRHVFVPLLHVAAVEAMGGSNGSGSARRGHKKK